MQEQPKIPKKPLLYYVVMVMLVMMLLNIFVFPLLLLLGLYLNRRTQRAKN